MRQSTPPHIIRGRKSGKRLFTLHSNPSKTFAEYLYLPQSISATNCCLESTPLQRRKEKGKPMNVFFIILLIAMLLLFGYAQLHKNVVKNPGQSIATKLEEEELKIR
jgi:hypothetical protein